MQETPMTRLLLSKPAKVRLLFAALMAVSGWSSAASDGGLGSVFERERSTTEDVIYFRNTDELRGTVLNDVIEISTPYGDVKLNLRRCAGVSFEGARANTEAIVTVNQNRLTGIGKDRVIIFKIGTSGEEIPVRKEKVRFIVLKRALGELSFLKSKLKTDLYVMANGDLLTGKAAKPSIKIQTDYGEISVAFSEIKRVEMQGGNNVTAVIKKTNGDTMRGTLLTEEFTLNLDVGATVESVYKDKLAKVFVNDGTTETGTHFGLMQPIRGESAGAQALDGKPWVNSLGMRFVSVPGTPSLFSIWETRVQDYEVFAKATSRSWEKPGFDQGPTHPAGNVSWNDANAFCQWLTVKERSEGKLGASQSYRLPTDEEWSLAVGLSNENGATPIDKSGKIQGVYPWGTQWPPPKGAGNYPGSLAVDNFEYTAPVGSFAANRYGLYDLGGNVWEWCEDELRPGSGTRVLRGASCVNVGPVSLLSSSRGHTSPDSRHYTNGFRCVLAGLSSP